MTAPPALPGRPAAALRRSDIAMAVGALAVVGMMVVPIPALLLDILLTFNLGTAVVILLAAISTGEPVQFSALPSLLLVTTLFRLALNVSSTRLVLLTGNAGAVIHQFGQFVVGGNPAVGFVVFLILVVIQFIVITKGAERVSEVSARFTLDSLPGKQMAIDSDMAAGITNEVEARRRRKLVQQEADFYGAMDGASKFVKGDAIAGLIIVAVNLVGGVVVGMLQQNMSLAKAWSHFALLTIGDGLVTQIPALLVSTAAAMVVTRTSGEAGLGSDVADQLARPRLLMLAGGVLTGLALVPGLPTLPFLLCGAGLYALGHVLLKRAGAVAPAGPEPVPAPPQAENMHALLPVDPLEVELGYGLVAFADTAGGGELVERLVAVRRQIALNLGLVVPYIRVRDNLGLPPDRYVIKLRGLPVGQFDLKPDHLLAIDGSGAAEPLPGEEVTEPAFGLRAIWIAPSQRQRADLHGYTVIDPSHVLVAHVTEAIKEHAADLLGVQEVRLLVDMVKEQHPALVEELTPRTLSLGAIQKVLQNLLREGVSIRDLVLILEVLAEWGQVTRDPDALTERVRVALRRSIAQQLGLGPGPVEALCLDPDLEEQFQRLSDRRGDLDPARTQAFLANLAAGAAGMVSRGMTPLMVVAPGIRALVRRLSLPFCPRLVVLSYAELDQKMEIKAVGVVSGVPTQALAGEVPVGSGPAGQG